VPGVSKGGPSQTDTDLIAAMARGERDALSLLYARHAPMLIALGRRILLDTRDAEDLVHDVFVEVWHAASSYDSTRGAPLTWLVVRTRSRALDRLRAVRRALVASERHPPPTSSLPAVDTSDHGTLNGALGDLPPTQRTVLELAYYEDLSATEIATRLGVPVGTVKSRTAAALGKLRARLGDSGEEAQ
jgi:RNA polymerase sigma-70 factor (ECF subfamily)